MPKGSMQGRIQVVEQSRCRTHRQQTTTIARTQSPLSVLIGIENSHYLIKTDFSTSCSPFPVGRGLGFRQGCRDRTPQGFMQGCIQVVEHGRCRTHRQQTTTIAETQSPQSVLIGIENLLYFYKKRLFLQAEIMLLFAFYRVKKHRVFKNYIIHHPDASLMPYFS